MRPGFLISIVFLGLLVSLSSHAREASNVRIASVSSASKAEGCPIGTFGSTNHPDAPLSSIIFEDFKVDLQGKGRKNREKVRCVLTFQFATPLRKTSDLYLDIRYALAKTANASIKLEVSTRGEKHVREYRNGEILFGPSHNLENIIRMVIPNVPVDTRSVTVTIAAGANRKAIGQVASLSVASLDVCISNARGADECQDAGEEQKK